MGVVQWVNCATERLCQLPQRQTHSFSGFSKPRDLYPSPALIHWLLNSGWVGREGENPQRKGSGVPETPRAIERPWTVLLTLLLEDTKCSSPALGLWSKSERA